MIVPYCVKYEKQKLLRRFSMTVCDKMCSHHTIIRQTMALNIQRNKIFPFFKEKFVVFLPCVFNLLFVFFSSSPFLQFYDMYVY